MVVRVLSVHDHGRDGNDHVKQRRHTPEQVIRKLREADRMLGEGRSIAEVAKALEVSEPTYHRWRNQYGGMKADDVKRLKALERENASLKPIMADGEMFRILRPTSGCVRSAPISCRRLTMSTTRLSTGGCCAC